MANVCASNGGSVGSDMRGGKSAWPPRPRCRCMNDVDVGDVWGDRRRANVEIGAQAADLMSLRCSDPRRVAMREVVCLKFWTEARLEQVKGTEACGFSKEWSGYLIRNRLPHDGSGNDGRAAYLVHLKFLTIV